MIDNQSISVSLFPSGESDNAITCRVDLRSHFSREIHSGMETRCTVNRVDTYAIAGSGTTQILIGNRLDQEITDSFEQFMKKILQKSEKVDFVIIGETKDLQKRLVNNMFEKRIHYLGYCPILKGTVGALDLYLNPDRLGGGWSSMIALYAGIPVVTLPTGDVAYNVSGEFVVSNYEEMYETICR